MKVSFALQALSALLIVAACPDEDGDHSTHTHSRRSSPPAKITPPTRALEWGDINIIHTTDSHGWLLGHQKKSFPEPNYRYVSERQVPVVPMWLTIELDKWRFWRLFVVRGPYEGASHC